MMVITTTENLSDAITFTCSESGTSASAPRIATLLAITFASDSSIILQKSQPKCFKAEKKWHQTTYEMHMMALHYWRTYMTGMENSIVQYCNQ
jgi:hypothetical protein